jgi:hypothetical protein
VLTQADNLAAGLAAVNRELVARIEAIDSPRRAELLTNRASPLFRAARTPMEQDTLRTSAISKRCFDIAPNHWTSRRSIEPKPSRLSDRTILHGHRLSEPVTPKNPSEYVSFRRQCPPTAHLLRRGE